MPADFLPILAEVSQQLAVSVDLQRTLRESVGYITAYLQETLSGVRVVRSFGRERQHVERMSALNEENRVANMRTVYLNATTTPIATSPSIAW